jgi:hypothetical protein
MFVGVILIVTVSLLPEKKEKEIDSQKINNSFDKNKYTWLSPNGSWITTKIFIIGIALMIISPMYVSFKWKEEYLHWDLESIKLLFMTLKTNVVPLNTWTKGDFLFIIVYMSVLLILVNLPTRYILDGKGISYGFFGIFNVSNHCWTSVVCFDIDSRNVLHIWFKPPLFKPDWSIQLPSNIRDEVGAILLRYSYRYSMETNEKRNEKIFLG